MKYSIERLNEQTLNSLPLLHTQCFGSNHPFEHFYTKYNTTILDSFPLGYFAVHNNAKVAFCCFFPANFMYKDKIIKACQAGDIMTHPAHQGKGLFVSLATQSFETAEKEGKVFVFGFSNANAYKGWLKLGWTFTEKWQCVNLSTGIPFFFRWSNRIPLMGLIQQKRLNTFSINYSEKEWKEHKPDSINGYVKKDADYFNYKAQCSNAKLIKIENFVVFAKISGNLIIGDVSYFPFSQYNDFVKALVKLGKQLLTPNIVFQFSKNHWLYEYFNKAGIKISEEESDGGIGYKQLSNSDMIDFNSIMHIVADADYF